jgi:hypothetical protein
MVLDPELTPALSAFSSAVFFNECSHCSHKGCTETILLHPVVGGSIPAVAMIGDLLWLCGLIPHPALVGVRQKQCHASDQWSLTILREVWGLEEGPHLPNWFGVAAL